VVLLAGVLLPNSAGVFAGGLNLDRDRAFYPDVAGAAYLVWLLNSGRMRAAA
jgi:hypothetical protein